MKNNVEHRGIKLGMQYLLWFFAVIFFFYQYGIRSSVPSVLNEDLQRYFSTDATGLGCLVSLFFLAYTLMQIPVGLIVDRYRPKKILTYAFFMVSVGEVAFISTDNYSLSLISQIFLGIGSSFAFVLVIKISNDYFSKDKVALVSSIAMSIGSFGPVLMGPLLAYLSSIFPWKNVVISIGMIGIFLSVTCVLLIREKSLPIIEHEPEDIKISTNICGELKDIFTNSQYIELSVFSMMVLAAMSAFCDTWGLTFLRHSYNFTKEEASKLISIAYAGTIVGGPAAAWLSNQFSSYKKVMLAETFISVFMYIVLVFVHLSTLQLGILLFLLGIVAACQFLAFPAVLSGTPKSIGATLTGVVNMITMLGVTLMSYLVGMGLDLSRNYTGNASYSIEDYRNSFLLLIASTIIAVIVLIFSKESYPKAKSKIEN